jgi:hypothetical protein
MSRQLLAAAALRPGRGVEADGGRRGQVETLGPAVDRHPHRDVGQLAYALRKSPGLVAEQPCRRVREQALVGGGVEIEVGAAVGGQDP